MVIGCTLSFLERIRAAHHICGVIRHMRGLYFVAENHMGSIDQGSSKVL